MADIDPNFTEAEPGPSWARANWPLSELDELNLGLDPTQATIDKVAGPIGESLIMTALGLAVAIPAVLGYNALVRGNKGVLQKLNRFAHDLHAYFVTGARVSAGGQANVVPMKKA